MDASGVDFSDRVDSKRKSYKTSSRRERILADGTRELGDLSDDDDDESLERKIARLKREVEEAKNEYSKRAAGKALQEDEAQDGDGLSNLSNILGQISISKRLGHPNLDTPPPRQTAGKAGESFSKTDEATYTVTYAPSYDETHALARVADFDRRMVLLERAIGIGSSATPEIDTTGSPRALIPTVQKIDRQISTLSQASTESLDTTTRKVRALAQEVAQLTEAQTKADELRTSTEPETSDQASKINALYGTLPTIENLTPLLPPLLDRLRSLRAIHSDAATASDALGRIEKQQQDMTEELKQWRDGLEKVEGAIKEGQKTMSGNTQSIESWVKELEGRMDKF